jgi:uncharacterized protein (TIGR03084 family)
MVDLAEILTDLHTESAELDGLVSRLAVEDWQLPTPADGWTVAHQIAHLTWTDRVARRSATDPAAFGRALAAAAENPTSFVDDAAEEVLAEHCRPAEPGEDPAPDPAGLLDDWRAGRAELAAALASAAPGSKLPWLMTTMSPVSMATGRLMETWAHGEDIAAAVGEHRLPTMRLRHVAFLGVRTMEHGFVVHGRPVPTEPVYVELTAPDGSTWAYGAPDATNRVTGPAMDFCLLVAQRAHRDDLALEVVGPVADEWLDVAQVFAGLPGPGRPPRRTAEKRRQAEQAERAEQAEQAEEAERARS